jgi:Porin subfamily
MRTIKSLVLGSTAALFAMGGAQAADLPVKAKAVEYVRICSLYGAGFFYIPGTDTCVKLGGYLRVDLTVHGGFSNQPFWNGDAAVQDRFANEYQVYSRLALTVDTRTATEYGVVRTFGQLDVNGANIGAANSINVGSSIDPSGISGQSFSTNVAGIVYPEFLFIQWGGLIVGKSASAYNTPWHGFPGNNTAFLVGGYDSVVGINNAQYTWEFGNGVSAAIGVDESGAVSNNRTQLYNATLIGNPGGPGTPATSVTTAGIVPTFANISSGIAFTGAANPFLAAMGTSYSGGFAPDFVGRVRVDQAWGMFQFSAAAHDVSPGYWASANTPNASTLVTGNNLTGIEVFGHPDSKWGGAVSAALQIKNLPTGAGDDVKIEGSVGEGATKYILGTVGPLPASFYMLKGNANTTGGTFAIGAINDGVYGGWMTPLQAGVQLTRGWGFRGALNHNWNPQWSSSLYGGIAQISYNQTAKDLWCASYGGTLANGTALAPNPAQPTFVANNVAFHPATPVAGSGYTCDPGFTISEIGLTTRWTPVKNLTFSTDILYAYLKTNMTGIATGTPSVAFPVVGGPLATFQYGNIGTLSVNFRVQRNF